MTEHAAPLLTAKIDLPYHLWLRVTVWPDIPTLRENAPLDDGTNNHGAVFVAEFPPTKCIGTLNLAATYLSTDTRIHEHSHMIDHFAYRAWDEKKARTSGKVASEIEVALKQAGLL